MNYGKIEIFDTSVKHIEQTPGHQLIIIKKPDWVGIYPIKAK